MTICDGDMVSIIYGEDDDDRLWLIVLVNGLQTGPSIGPFKSADDREEAHQELLNRMTLQGIDYEEVTRLQ